MARVSEADVGGKVRARAAASIDATDGLFGGAAGFENLLCVEIDGNGELILATGPDCAGVIDVTEGRGPQAVDLDNFRQVRGGKVYTVLKRAAIQEIGDGTVAAGDLLYADSGTPGDIRVGAAGGAGDSFVGFVLPDDTVPGGAGLKLDLDVNNLAPGTA